MNYEEEERQRLLDEERRAFDIVRERRYAILQAASRLCGGEKMFFRNMDSESAVSMRKQAVDWAESLLAEIESRNP